jgi:hypothetical protein
MNATGVESGGAQGDDRQGTSVATLPATEDKPRPRLTGCPVGCLRHHEHDWTVHERCNYCTSLGHAERVAMHDCSDVCPLGRGVVT